MAGALWTEHRVAFCVLLKSVSTEDTADDARKSIEN